MQTNTGATVYNKYLSSGVEKYQRTQIPAVMWENRKAANVIQSGLIASDSTTVYISFGVGADYVKPKAWQALTSKSGKWTLQDGDYIVKGLVSDEITTSPLFTMSQLKAKYDSVMQIKSVDTMDMGSPSMQHWQVGAS
jgi:hypothetical protein